MKKLILLAAFAVFYNISVAQVTFGIHVGPNFSMGKFEYNEAAFAGSNTHEQKNKMKVGVVGGLVAEIPFSSQLAFRPELNYVQHGTKNSFYVTSLFGAYSAEQKITLNYVQIPLNVVYKMPAGTGNMFFGLGPAIEIGLSGKNKYTSATDPSDNETRDVKFDGEKSDDHVNDPNNDFFNDDHLKRVNVAINVLAGYKLAMGVFMKIGYTHGFMDIDPNKGNVDNEDKSSYKSKAFNITFGYMFGGSKASSKN